MKIRKFKEQDAKIVSCMIRDNLFLMESNDSPIEAIKYMYKYFSPETLIKKSKTRKIFVMINENNEIIGTISLERNTIYTVFVLINLHKKKIGTKLIQHVINIALKGSRQYLRVPATYSSQGFYKKLGFKVTNKVKLKGFGIIYRMRKYL